MKITIKVITALVKISSIALGFTAYQQMIPAQYLPFAVIFFAGASAAKEVGLILCDYLDDGIRNNSYKLPCLAFFFGFLCLLPACSITKDQWLKLGGNLLNREAPILLNEIEAANTAAKQPVKPVQP